MSNDTYSKDNIANAGFSVDSKGNGQVSGNGGSVTVGPASDPNYAGGGYISVDTGQGHHSTFVTVTDSSGTHLERRH